MKWFIMAAIAAATLAASPENADAQYGFRRNTYPGYPGYGPGYRGYRAPMPQPMPRAVYPPLGYNYGIGQTAHITPYYCSGGRCWYYHSR